MVFRIEEKPELTEEQQQIKAAYLEKQMQLADCVLGAWFFTTGGAAAGLLTSLKSKSYLPLGYGVGAGIILDVFSGCYRCQEQWTAMKAAKPGFKT